MDNGQLDGRRVLITAGAGGIGKVAAQMMSARGARVHVCDVSRTALDALCAENPEISQSVCDVSDPSAVDALFEDIATLLGGLDVLVNNAGIAGPTGPIEDLALEDWNACIAVGLTGQFLCARRATPLLKAADHGALITMSSAAGRFGYAFRTPYSAVKFGVIGLTKSLAVELGPNGVAVNSVLPGMVEGPRIDTVIAARAKTLGISQKEMRAKYLENISMRRMVTPEDVAETLAFLASRPGWAVSGQCIGVCGNIEKL